MPEPEYDPTRLTQLAKVRDQRRAIARDVHDQYQRLRERRADVLRRAHVATMNADTGHGVYREEALEQAKRLNAEAEELRAQMDELTAQGDAETAEASEAARLLSSCLDFAQKRDLPIPSHLAEEARPAIFAPLGAPVGGAK